MMRPIVLSKRFLAIGCLALFAFYLAVAQPFGYSPDFKQYEFFFQEVRQYAADIRAVNRFEPGFFYISAALSKLIISDVLLYGSFVVFSISLKFAYAFKGVFGYYFWLGVTFYFFKFFPLLELTQLRAALGSAMLIAAVYFFENKKFLIGLLVGLAGALFHYSVLMVLPLLFLPAMKRWHSILLVIASFSILSLLSAYLIEVAGYGFSVFESYENSSYSMRSLNKFSPVFFPEFFIIICSLICWGDLDRTMQRIVVIEMLGFSMFYALADYGVVATRGRELFSVLWLYFVAHCGVSGKRIRFFANIFVFASAVLYFYIFFISGFFVDASHWNE